MRKENVKIPKEEENVSEAKMEGVTQTFQIKTRDRKYIGFEDTEAETQWQGAFTFIQAADTQLGLQEKYIEKKTNPGWEKEVKWCTQMVTKVNKMNPAPKFLVICGDLIDAYPYERNGEEKETRQHQENDLKMVLSELQIPLVCVCGNHDVGDTPTAKTILKYQSSFGDDYFSFWCGGAYFLALNSQFWQDRREVETLARAQDEWLEAQLLYIEQHKPRHSIILQHIPPFIDTIDEPSQYFNLPSYIRQEMLDRFITAGVRYVFCGHYHRNAGGVYNGLEVIVTSAVGAQLGTDVNGYRVVNVMEDKVVHCYHGVE